MRNELDRLVRQLDAWRPGDDASALAALVAHARRRNDPALLERLARCFVDPRLTALPGHLLRAPANVAELGADLAELARAATTHADYAEYRWLSTLAALRSRPTECALAEQAIALLKALGSEPRTALERDEVEAMAWTLWDGPERFRLVDRWLGLGGVERAACLLTAAAGWAIVRQYDDGQVICLELEDAPSEGRVIARDGLVRLYGWLRAEPGRAPAAAALAEAMRAVGTLERDTVEATVALWLCDHEPDFVDALASRLLALPGAPGSWEPIGLAPLIAALRPDHAELLQLLLARLEEHPEHVGDLLAAMADRMGVAALAPLQTFRQRASHHKYVSLAAQAIGRIPGRETVRTFALELGHKARSRAEDARAACLLHPVDTLIELPQQIATLAADPAKKGRAERQRQIEAMTLILEELAAQQPRVTWILLATLTDAELQARIADKIPDAHRRDPIAEEAEHSADDTQPWLAAWPLPPPDARPPLLVEPCGSLDRDGVRRVALGLAEPTTRRERVEQLAANVDPDTLARLAEALLEGWNRRGRRRFSDIWVFGFAARFADADARPRLAALLAELFDDREFGRLASAAELLGGESAREPFEALSPFEQYGDAERDQVTASIAALVGQLAQRPRP